jgi:hypothetical protein
MRPYATVSAAGYQAKEVVDDGECSFASDIYAVGVSLVEVWAGEMWAGAETRGEGYPGLCLPARRLCLCLCLCPQYATISTIPLFSTSVSGLALLVYQDISYQCFRP